MTAPASTTDPLVDATPIRLGADLSLPVDLATEAMGTYESDTYVILTEKGSWRKGGKPAIVERP